jgi:hypothetical protein
VAAVFCSTLLLNLTLVVLGVEMKLYSNSAIHKMRVRLRTCNNCVI